MSVTEPEPALLPTSLPAQLRAWREEAGLTREAVCAHFQGDPLLPNLSFPWLAAVEGGYARGKPSGLLIAHLARYYGHDPAELVPA